MAFDPTAATTRVRQRLEDAGLLLDSNTQIMVTDFGRGEWEKQGLGVVTRVNEPEYSSRYLVLEPGQECPLHHHQVKKKTLFVLNGELHIWADGQTIMLIPGESVTLLPGVAHSYNSLGGAVVEEISTHDNSTDSVFAAQG